MAIDQAQSGEHSNLMKLNVESQNMRVGTAPIGYNPRLKLRN